MPGIAPTLGTGEYIEVNGAVLQAASWERNQNVNMMEFPVSGMTPNADGVFETPHDGNLNKTTISVRGPYNSALPFHGAPYALRKGAPCTARFGQSAALVTPIANYKVQSTRDGNDVVRHGEWEAVLVPADDGEIGYFTGVA